MFHNFSSVPRNNPDEALNLSSNPYSIRNIIGEETQTKYINRKIPEDNIAAGIFLELLKKNRLKTNHIEEREAERASIFHYYQYHQKGQMQPPSYSWENLVNNNDFQ